ncbi:hypothetical protein ACJ72_03457 [Emergomyces africanus]|uniref:Uncharacterized protein n=1 Tax=Emergomyces africanus TaxID=1955775 RepID=A0A1B7NZI5_9EURO|nr:hypothetical protein ACJ72_03457 [Emergomyces africanus]
MTIRGGSSGSPMHYRQIHQKRVLARMKPMADYGNEVNVMELMSHVYLSNEDLVTERRFLGIHAPVRAFSPDFIGHPPQCELGDAAAELNFATSTPY